MTVFTGMTRRAFAGVRGAVAVVLAAGLVLAPGLGGAASAQGARADVGEILFDKEHFAAAAPGATIRYSYVRTSKDAERTKPSFKDVVELRLESGSKPEARTVSVTLFKGPMHRPAGPFPDVTWNPIAIMMLEYHLGDFAKILGGNARYFKNAIRAGMREAATSEPVKITVGGKEVDATRITVKPFVKDPQAARFGVFVNTAYQFVVSDAVPGSIHEIRITTPDPAGGEPVLEEVTRYVEN